MSVVQSCLIINKFQISFYFLQKEYDDSLTPEQRKDGRSQKKKSKKPQTIFKPEGILGELNDALQQTSISSFNILLDKMKEGNEGSALNQPVDLQSSTLLHVASRMNQLGIVW